MASPKPRNAKKLSWFAANWAKNYWQKSSLMKRSVWYSILLHSLIALALIISLPNWKREKVDLGQAINVTMVSEVKQKPAPPKPPAKVQKPTPPPAPKPEPVPTVVPAPPPPKPVETPIPEAAPEPPKPVQAVEEVVPIKSVEEPKRVEIPKPLEPPKKVPQKKEDAKPTPPPKPSFAATLKNLQKEIAPSVQQETDPTLDLKKEVEAATANLKQQANPNLLDSLTPQGLKDDEMARVRDQVIACWNPPVGAKDVQKMRVVIEANLGPDKVVQSARITERSNETTSSFADSALRAVLVCKKLDVPDGKYEIWNRLLFAFTPDDIF